MSQHDKPPKSDSHEVIKSSSFLYEMRYVKYNQCVHLFYHQAMTTRKPRHQLQLVPAIHLATVV